MRMVPRQLAFDHDISTIAGHADYAAENELLLTMDAIISPIRPGRLTRSNLSQT